MMDHVLFHEYGVPPPFDGVAFGNIGFTFHNLSYLRLHNGPHIILRYASYVLGYDSRFLLDGRSNNDRCALGL